MSTLIKPAPARLSAASSDMTPFASSISLRPAAENLWAGEADPAYAHFGGRFGGWTAAVLLKAAMEEPGDRGDPLSLTVLYTDALGDGPIQVSTRLLRAGSRLQFWRSEVSQRDKLCAHAQATFGIRRETLRFTDAEMPQAPPPDDPSLQESVPPVPFGAQFSARWHTPSPLLANTTGKARSVFWLKDKQGRAIDHVLLAAMADFAPPRIMWKRKGFVMSSTVSMTVHFHATPEELAEVGDGYVLSEVEARRCEGGYFDHELKLWSRSGALLATSEQVAAFRD
jgi:acyl-CoA thioesterase